MSSIIIVSGSIAVLVAASIFVGMRLRRRHTENEQSTSQPFGPVEAKKNTLRSELHDLGLGINQVKGYIAAIKHEVENAATMRADATTELEKAEALKSQIEAAIEHSTTDAQVDAFALGLGEARRHVQKARRIALQHTPDEDD
jgi:chromosome segregation ATPase